MVLNTGYIEGTCADGDIVIRIYYDATQPAGPNQPLINGPRGWCLDIRNVSGRKSTLTVSGVTNQPLTLQVQQGDPVTTGPQSGRSRTAAQMAQLGFTTRGSVGNFVVSCD